MATLTMSATVQASHTPPRVRLVITDTDTPAIDSVTVTRTDPDGSVAAVRTTDGEPLRLYASGGSRSGTAYDYVVPYGEAVTYSTVEQPAVTVTATVPETEVWLIHPQIPARSMPVQVAGIGPRQRAVNRGIFQPQGRRDAVAITDGQRKAPAGDLQILTRTLVEKDAIDALIDDAAVLFLNIPSDKGWGVPPCYVSLGESVEDRLVPGWGAQPMRVWSWPYAVTEAPAGGMLPDWNLGDVAASYTLAQAAALTLQQVLLGPNP